MNKTQIVKKILGKHYKKSPKNDEATAFAPTNIALCKYWGKRDEALHLPTVSSLSITLPEKGTTTKIRIKDQESKSTESRILNPESHSPDFITLNDQPIAPESPFAQRLSAFLDLFRPEPYTSFIIETTNNIPTAAGLASSASGYAALVLALNQLFGWELEQKQLSILARLGSGSASRSIFNGFVKWEKGRRKDGMDSYAKSLNIIWPEFCIGIVTLDAQQKSISSRQAMKQTMQTSTLYSAFVKQSECDLKTMEEAIKKHDFSTVGRIAESNALMMHATMTTAWPPICYTTPETIKTMQKIWALREQGLDIYFTQDAGPNLKLLFESKNTQKLQQLFPGSISVSSWT